MHFLLFPTSSYLPLLTTHNFLFMQGKPAHLKPRGSEPENAQPQVECLLCSRELLFPSPDEHRGSSSSEDELHATKGKENVPRDFQLFTELWKQILAIRKASCHCSPWCHSTTQQMKTGVSVLLPKLPARITAGGEQVSSISLWQTPCFGCICLLVPTYTPKCPLKWVQTEGVIRRLWSHVSRHFRGPSGLFCSVWEKLLVIFYHWLCYMHSPSRESI